MTKAVLEIRLLTPADWRVLRNTRLRALLDSPDAFTSDYRRERGLNEHQWLRWFDAAAWVVAVERDKVIGLVALVDGQKPEGRHVESIWVAPTHRQRGVFRALLDEVIEIGRLMGLDELLLWVLEDNTVARRVYARLGFVDTDERQKIESGGQRYERRLRLPI
ncbi:GNAT family N-acetyltransferase [Pseudonocardia acaciae]|uniref:GNAT family N-acetyltransferase n=1 Tax=Pseudonocardia acaciae TaxID=551276 RepID=UPI000688BA1A|nr:GNAT family N-acetyltransferase [Pseudonocardia acaciae]